jgi:hypothetical protein
MQIQVTRQDIRHGTRASAHGCAVALALHRAIPQANAVLVSQNEMLITVNGRVRLFTPSTALATFIGRFDIYPSWWPFLRPFAFDLPL